MVVAAVNLVMLDVEQLVVEPNSEEEEDVHVTDDEAGRMGPKGDQKNDGINAEDQEPQHTCIRPSTMKELTMISNAMIPSLPVMSSRCEVRDDQII